MVLKFSKTKTQCVHFCQLRKLHDNPQLYLYGSLIPVVDEKVSKFSVGLKTMHQGLSEPEFYGDLIYKF